jgi:hypothetical protein
MMNTFYWSCPTFGNDDDLYIYATILNYIFSTPCHFPKHASQNIHQLSNPRSAVGRVPGTNYQINDLPQRPRHQQTLPLFLGLPSFQHHGVGPTISKGGSTHSHATEPTSAAPSPTRTHASDHA